MPTNVTPIVVQTYAEISAYDRPLLRATYNPTSQTYVIGYRGLFEAITPGDRWTPEQAAFHLQSEIQTTHASLVAAIPNFEAMNVTQQSAVVHAAIASGGPITFLSENPGIAAAIEDEQYVVVGAIVTASLEESLGDVRASALGDAIATGEAGGVVPPLTAEQANSDLSRTANIEPDNSTTIAQATGSLPEMGFPIPVDASASDATKALWTNRVPMHEPWPRVLKSHPTKDPDATQEYADPTGMRYENIEVSARQDINRHHNNELSDDSAWVGRVEGNELIERGPLWKR